MIRITYIIYIKFDENIKIVLYILVLRSPDGDEHNLKLPDAKVVSIIGNTGEGKSYALNRTFFARDDDPKQQNTFQEVCKLIGYYLFKI